LLKENPAFEFEFHDHMQFKNVTNTVATYWLLQNKRRTKRPSLKVPPRVPIFTTHSPPSTPGLMGMTPMCPMDFTQQLSSRLNQLQHQSFPTQSFMKHNNPSIMVDSPGHHEHASQSNFVTNTGLSVCIPSTNNNPVNQDQAEAVSHKFRHASNSSLEVTDDGICLDTNLEEVPDDKPVRHRRPGICMSPQSSNVSDICQQFEKIVGEHKTKQERLNRRTSIRYSK